jgi:hypothetical protein
MTPKFRAKIQAGRIKLYPGEKLYYDHVLQTLEGQTVHVAIGKVKGLRTEQQMRYYWGVVVKLIADYTGDDIDTIHEFLKDKFAPRKTITVQGEARTVPGCTHHLFKENFFEDYVDHIRAWASSELQIVIPDPNQVQP